MNDNFATELLTELKAQTKRWFMAFCVMVAVEVVTVGCFIWYLSLPTENVTVDGGTGYANYVGSDMSGDINNGKDKSDKEGEASTEEEPEKTDHEKEGNR